MIKNLAEEHVLAAYDVLKAHFPFCGCAVCRGRRTGLRPQSSPARYVATREGSVVTELNLEKDQTRARST